jgi:hypothetical protein
MSLRLNGHQQCFFILAQILSERLFNSFGGKQQESRREIDIALPPERD